MITAIIRYRYKALCIELPHDSCDLSKLLTESGIRIPMQELPISGTKPVKIGIYADNDLGDALIERVPKTVTLSALNSLCQSFDEICRWGYGEELLRRVLNAPAGRFDTLEFIAAQAEREWFTGKGRSADVFT